MSRAGKIIAGAALTFVLIVFAAQIFLFGDDPGLRAYIDDLELENASLRERLVATLNNAIELDSPFPLIRARVYSTYPLNNRHLITVAAGRSVGVRPFMPVTIGGHTLIGQVVEVYDRVSVVRTIFDPTWEISVRIGDDEVDGLLVGGQQPRVRMIERAATAEEGELVQTAGSLFPYGLFVGVISNLRATDAEAFQEGDVDLGYRFRDIRDIDIITNFTPPAAS